NSVTVSGLGGSTSYSFAVFEYNGTAGSENYLPTTPGTGSQPTTLATYTWNGGASAAWTSAASWSPSRTVPVANDNLQFNAGGSTTATSVPTETDGQLLVSGSSTVALQAGAANTVTLGGGSGALSVAG